MRTEVLNLVEQIRKSLKLLGQRMDVGTAPHRLEEFNAMIEDGDLWSDPARAQRLMRERHKKYIFATQHYMSSSRHA